MKPPCQPLRVLFFRFGSLHLVLPCSSSSSFFFSIFSLSSILYQDKQYITLEGLFREEIIFIKSNGTGALPMMLAPLMSPSHSRFPCSVGGKAKSCLMDHDSVKVAKRLIKSELLLNPPILFTVSQIMLRNQVS